MLNYIPLNYGYIIRNYKDNALKNKENLYSLNSPQVFADKQRFKTDETCVRNIPAYQRYAVHINKASSLFSMYQD